MNNNALHARGNLCFLGNCKLLDTFSYFEEVDISFPSNKLVTWKTYKISNFQICTRATKTIIGQGKRIV